MSYTATGGQEDTICLKRKRALRIFKQGDSLHYVYQILNASIDSARHADLEVHTRLFRDGKQVYEGKPTPLETASQRDPKRLVAACVLGGLVEIIEPRRILGCRVHRLPGVRRDARIESRWRSVRNFGVPGRKPCRSLAV